MACPIASSAFLWPAPRPKASWKGAPDRALWFKRLFIDHGEIRQIVNDAWSMLHKTIASDSSFGMLILAGSGAGKTQLAQELKANVHRVFGRIDPEKTIVPALLLSVPDRCTPRAICISILKELGDPDPEHRPRLDLVGQTAGMLKACEVRMIIIDNVQDIPAKRGERGIEQVSNRLRELIDQTSCLWLMLGTDAARSVVDNESQLIKRLPYRAHINYFDIQTEREKRIFLQLLLRIDAWLPLTESNEQLLRQLAGRLYIATEGILDRLRQLLDLACDEARRKAREHLVQENCATAFARLYGPDVENPFAEGFVIRQLRGKDEPFERLNGSPALQGARRQRRPNVDAETATPT